MSEDLALQGTNEKYNLIIAIGNNYIKRAIKKSSLEDS